MRLQSCQALTSRSARHAACVAHWSVPLLAAALPAHPASPCETEADPGVAPPAGACCRIVGHVATQQTVNSSATAPLLPPQHCLVMASEWFEWLAQACAAN